MIIFNIIKHHFWDTISILSKFRNRKKTNLEVLQLLNKIGHNHCDVYKGNLTTKEIIEDYQAKKNHFICFKEKQNFFLCRDNSLWIVKDIYKNSKLYKHIHPARNTIINKYSSMYGINPKYHIRIDANKYKTFLLCYWFYLNKIKENHINFIDYLYKINLLEFINIARTTLCLPDLSTKQFNKDLYLKLFVQFFE